MKPLIFGLRLVVVLSGVLSAHVMAVTVKNCPQNFRVEIGQISPFSDKDLLTEVGTTNEIWGNLKELTVLRNQLQNVKKDNTWSKMEFQLSRKITSKCGYQLVGGVPVNETNLENETRLETKSGRDLLRLALPLVKGSTDLNNAIWIYFTVDSYSADTLVIKEMKGYRVLAFQDHGAPRNTIGWVSNVKVSILNRTNPAISTNNNLPSLKLNCVLEALNGKSKVQASVDLNPKTFAKFQDDGDPISSDDSLKVGEEAYSFDLMPSLDAKGNFGLDIMFFENLVTQDEVGEMSCDLQGIQKGQRICEEPIENEAGIFATFYCDVL